MEDQEILIRCYYVACELIRSPWTDDTSPGNY